LSMAQMLVIGLAADQESGARVAALPDLRKI
jgi:hypothetical protein